MTELYRSTREFKDVGRTDNPVIDIPDDAKRFTAAVSRDGWTDDSSDVVDVKVELSMDGGRSWRPAVGFTARGGEVYDEGELITESNVSFDVPSGTNRKARVIVNRKRELTTQLICRVL